MADALADPHSLGLIHRDIKPENILFQAGHAAVSDFGIARAVSRAARDQGGPLTESGIAVGTLAYMSLTRTLFPATGRSERAAESRDSAVSRS